MMQNYCWLEKSLATWVASMHIHALICSAHDEIKEKKRAGQKCWDYIHPCLWKWNHVIILDRVHSNVLWSQVAEDITIILYPHGPSIRCVHIVRGIKGKNLRQTIDAFIFNLAGTKLSIPQSIGTYHAWGIYNENTTDMRYLSFCKFIKNYNKNFWNSWNLAYPYLTVWCTYISRKYNIEA